MLNVVRTPDMTESKAIGVLLNSVIFLIQFFLLKEETTGRYINIRFYDLYEMILYPDRSKIPALAKVYEKYSKQEFPSLREQLDMNFDQRYKDFWSLRTHQQPSLFNILNNPVDPSHLRIEFDLNICKALGVEVTKEELITIYGTIVKEMIITRHLARD